MNLRFKLTNTGRRTGTEVAQAYVTLPASTGEPSKRLAGWSRVALAAGRSRTVEITLSRADLADLHLLEHWDSARNDWATARGRYRFDVGGSSSATAVHGSLTVR